MRVLLIDVVKSPTSGGASTHRYELVKNLSNFVEIYCMSEIDEFDNIVGKHVVKIKRYDRFPILNKFLYLKSLFKLVLCCRYDLIYMRNIYAGLIGYLLGKITASKLVFEINSITKDESKHLKIPENNLFVLKVRVADIIELFLARNSDAVISVTDGIKNYLIENGTVAEKINVINNGADIDTFRPEKQNRDELKTKYNLHSNDLVVLFQGSLVKYQGVAHLIESAPTVINEIPNAKFFIVGEGIEYSHLVNLVKKMNLSRYFVFTRRVKYEEMPGYINLADVCVAPFIRERNEKIGLSPLKIYEYMACSKPVVASNIKGVGDILNEYQAGIAVSPENHFELSNAIIKLLNSKELRHRMGENGRKACIEKHNWLKVAEETKEVFDKLVSNV